MHRVGQARKFIVNFYIIIDFFGEITVFFAFFYLKFLLQNLKLYSIRLQHSKL